MTTKSTVRTHISEAEALAQTKAALERCFPRQSAEWLDRKSADLVAQVAARGDPMLATYKQCAELTARKDFSFKANGKGRTVTFKVGQRFWVTNSSADQARGFIVVDRAGKGCISHGYAFTPAQVADLFHA